MIMIITVRYLRSESLDYLQVWVEIIVHESGDFVDEGVAVGLKEVVAVDQLG